MVARVRPQSGEAQMNSEQAIRQYLDARGGRLRVRVEHLLVSFGINEIVARRRWL